MQEAIESLIVDPSVPADVAEHIERAESWAGEPFLHPGEDAERVLAEGTARRRALDDAIAEMDAGERRTPTPQWKVRYGLMLGLERVLSDKPPRLASGTELRRHQVDALAGMLTELIAANQQQTEANGNGNGGLVEVEEEEDEEFELEGPEDEEQEAALTPEQDPGAKRRYRFRHTTASGKTIAAAGFVEAARTLGVLILTHRRLLVTQFDRELKAEGYGDRMTPAITEGQEPIRGNPLTIQTYAWFARHVGSLSHDAYQLVICEEAHTALGEKKSAAIHSVPIIGGDFDEGELAKVLDHEALNQAAASLYRDRFDSLPGIVYAAGVEHAYNLAKEFRAAGLKAEAVSGRTPPVKLAETLAAYERGELNVLINAMLLAEGWNSPRATVVMHLAPTASKRVYQQRIGRIMRLHPRKEAGVVLDFVPKGATHNERVISLHSLLDADFYREGARVTPAPRRRAQRRARRSCRR